MSETGYRALYSLPLNDDQGRVGLLLYESSDPDFLELPHTEMIKVLAGQATVAIRNALLYREVPLISLLEPLMQKRAALLRTSGGRRLAMAAVAAAVVLFLVLCPLPMRVQGTRPSRRSTWLRWPRRWTAMLRRSMRMRASVWPRETCWAH